MLAAAEEADRQAKEHFARRLAHITDYRYDKAQCMYWDLTNGELYKAESVDASIPRDEWPTRMAATRGGGQRVVPVKPSVELARIENGMMVDGSTWWPGKPRMLEDELVTARGSLALPGALTHNTYMQPDRAKLRSNQTADKWIKHTKDLFPDPVEHEHFFDYAAHMIQRPEEKTNHGIVISGAQGIGKDTMLLPLRYGVGMWNVAEISPDAIEEKFNGYLRSVMLVINEVRPHNEDHRASAFYNRMKPLLASPPELLPMEMKHAHVVYVRNVLRVFLTTNDHLTMHIPAEDRRLFVMHSRAHFRWESDDYFTRMFDYFTSGGIDAVIRWLMERDISNFNPGAAPKMTTGKEQIIASTQHARSDIISEAFEAYVADAPPPLVFFPVDLLECDKPGAPSFDDKSKLASALKAKNLHYRMADLGYIYFKNPAAARWSFEYSVEGVSARFEARTAFVRKSVPVDKQWDLVIEEGKKRALARVAAKRGAN